MYKSFQHESNICDFKENNMTISAAMVKELRTKTGAGIMDAKKALTESGGEIEEAIDWLRKKGIAKAAKKSGRATREGQIGALVQDNTGVLVEINSETDFVARNSKFCEFARQIATAAISVDDLEGLMAAQLGEGSSVAEALSSQIAGLGENLSISGMKKISGNNITSYIHNQTETGVGKIGVLVAYEGDNSKVARQVAMHVAATNPIALSEDDMPNDRVKRERQVLAEIAQSSGKPPAIIEKIVDGGMRKFFQNETLLNQKFVINPELTVKQAAEQAKITICGYAFLRVGASVD